MHSARGRAASSPKRRIGTGHERAEAGHAVDPRRRSRTRAAAAVIAVCALALPAAAAGAFLSTSGAFLASFRAAAVFVPRPTSLPAVTGSAVSGQALTASTGTWANSPASFAYQWERCASTGGSCAAVAGALASAYTLGEADVAHTMRVLVTATNSGGSASSLSGPSAIIAQRPADILAPSISGSARQGKTLTATPGTWSGYPAPSFTYQWQRCNIAGGECAPIAAATTATYVPVAADAGRTLRAAVTAHNSAGSATAASAATAPVS